MNGFDAAERLAIVAEWRRQSAAWRPRDGHGPGCVMMIGAVVLLLGLPKLGQYLAIPPALGRLALVLVPLLGVGGFFVMQSRVLPGDPRRIAADAVALLAAGSSDAAARRTAAVALLFHGWDHRGPTMSVGYDHAAARHGLGPARDYVRAVEKVLRDELQITPVFTADGRPV